jgi:hypothetical protein
VRIRIYKIKILPVVLYGYETCALILRQKHRLRVFENRMLRRKFGPEERRSDGRLEKTAH